MNSREIDIFTARLHRFTDKGQSLDDAEKLANMLVTRDRGDAGKDSGPGWFI